MMTQAWWRRRPLLAESSVRLGIGTSHAVDPVAVGAEQEWTDWANLMPDLVGEISGRLSITRDPTP